MQELEAVGYADFCGLIDSFFALQEEPFRFRTFIRDYIKSITVYRESVVFSLDCGFGLLDGVVKEITAKRSESISKRLPRECKPEILEVTERSKSHIETIKW